MSYVIHSYPNNPNVQKALVAAQYSGVEIELNEDIQMGKTNKSDEFLAKFPLGKVPAMDTPDGPIFESNSIARHIARVGNDVGLLGQNTFENSQVDMWLDVVNGELGTHGGGWGSMAMARVAEEKKEEFYVKYDANRHMFHREKLLTVLEAIENHLVLNTYLVGHQVTLADVCMAVYMKRAFEMLLSPELRNDIMHIVRWYETCRAQPQFIAVLGEEVTYCEEELGEIKIDLKEHFQNLNNIKSHLSNLPKDPEARSEGLAELWSNWSPKKHTIFKATYKHNGEHKVDYEANNFAGGFLTRIEHYKKHAWAVMLVLESLDDEGNVSHYDITSVWIMRGKKIHKDIKESPQFDQFDWVKVADKKEFPNLVNSALNDDVFDGLEVSRRFFYK